MRRYKIEFIRVLVLLTGIIVANLLGVTLLTSATILMALMVVWYKPTTMFIETFFGEYIGELDE